MKLFRGPIWIGANSLFRNRRSGNSAAILPRAESFSSHLSSEALATSILQGVAADSGPEGGADHPWTHPGGEIALGGSVLRVPCVWSLLGIPRVQTNLG